MIFIRLFRDLPRVDLRPYRLMVFPGLFVVTPEKLAVLKRHVFQGNRTVLFAYAPGICDGKSLDPERVKALTGSAFKTPGIRTVPRDGWTAVYVPRYEDLTPQVLRQAAVEAGVTIVCQDAVPVYANERLLAIHTAHGGEKTVTLPSGCRQVRELYTGWVSPVWERRFRYTFKTPDTALFELLP